MQARAQQLKWNRLYIETPRIKPTQTQLTGVSWCVLRAAADPKRSPEHRGEGRSETLQSSGGGRAAVTSSVSSPEEQPVSERGAPSWFTGAARQAAQPRAPTRHVRRQPVQQHRRGPGTAAQLDQTEEQTGPDQEPDAQRDGL